MKKNYLLRCIRGENRMADTKPSLWSGVIYLVTTTSALLFFLCSPVEALQAPVVWSAFSLASIADFTQLTPTGACCDPYGRCIEATEEWECRFMLNGVYQGDDTGCASASCGTPPPPPITGACCMPDGFCTNGTKAECNTAGGVYQGDKTDCASVECEQPTPPPPPPPPPPKPPVASFIFSPIDPVAGEIITFTSKSTDEDGQIVKYAWDFDSDGVVDVEGAEEAEVVTHAYTAIVGRFIVRLTVTDDQGLASSQEQNIQVGLCADSLNENAKRVKIWFPDANGYTDRGILGRPIEADSGQKLEIFWRGNYYELRFTGVGGSPEGRVGQCHFIDGVNDAYYWAPDANGNGKPDYFIRTRWISIDGGDDDKPKDGEKNGLLDVIIHNYEVCYNKYSIQRILHEYACGPPISMRPDVGDFFCKPPWKSEPQISFEDPSLGPESEAIFDDLLSELPEVSTSEIVMGRFTLNPCDLDFDGDCDKDDIQVVERLFGTSWQDIDYNPFADSNSDGYITAEDKDIIFPKNQPPTANAGPDQTVSVGPDCMATVTLDGWGFSYPAGDPVTFQWAWNGGSEVGESPIINLPLGTHTISLIVNDGNVNSEPDTVDVTVIDQTLPEITLSVSPNTLWPPNHKMVPIAVLITATDSCDPNPILQLKSITMNEGEETNTYDPAWDNTLGDGRTLDDIQVDESGNISLRAERSGTGMGRIYIITYSVTDASGNTATASATVTVPHNQ